MPRKLAVLLPLTSKTGPLCDLSPKEVADRLLDNLALGAAASTVELILGVDEDDATLLQLPSELESALSRCAHLPELDATDSSCCRAFPPVVVRCVVFKRAALDALPAGPLCWMWGRLAAEAVRGAPQPDVLLLLGDDTRLSPPGWPALVLQRFAEDPRLTCLLLHDLADPGYPSFPAVRSTHLHAFGRMLPEAFVNQGGDPFLAELYRRVGGLDVFPEVTVENKVGGIELPGNTAYIPPRYPRVYVGQSEVLRLLDAWAAHARTRGLGKGPTLSVDVLVPSFRAQAAHLEAVMEACSRVDPELCCDVRFGIVVDNPACPAAARDALRQIQSKRLGRLRLRFHATNMGASCTRNKLLSESLAERVIFLDDDVIPSPGLADAYVRAFRKHPQVLGFAGPSLLPKQPATLASVATHLSDVSFFWDAPLTMEKVPWAVTANVAFRNTAVRFDPRFPKTGGGEDVDFCLKASPGGMLSVPEAHVHHPLWNDGRPCLLRFGKWAFGDGELVDVHPAHCYRAAPNAAELLWALLLLQLAAQLLRFVLVLPALAAPVGMRTHAAAPPDPIPLLQTSVSTAVAMLASRAAGLLLGTPWALLAVGVVLTEALVDLWRNLLIQERYKRHPCRSLALRAAASLHATGIRLVSESGRIAGHLSRGRPVNLCRRFDWFCGMAPGVVASEQRGSLMRLAAYAAGCALAAHVWGR